MIVEKWHRRLGVGIFVFLLSFVATGVALQHAADLGLDDSYVPAAAAVALYGVAPDATDDYAVGHRWVSHAGQFLYLDGAPLPYLRVSELRGAVAADGALWIVGDDKLWLLSARGETLDEFSFGDGLPDVVRNVAVAANGDVVIRGLRGDWTTSASANAPAPEWRAYAAKQPPWSAPTAAPPLLRERVLAHARAHYLSWERLLTDLHSGRLFGVAGVIVADVAALLLLLLALMGLLLWSKRKPSRGAGG